MSVLIDTYNHEAFIERAIRSVLDQDMPMDAVEILVVDDGSSDATPDIVRRFAPRVRLLQKSNGGQASAFNFGFAEAQGDIVATLDGDDWWAPQKLRRVLEALESNPDVGMVGHGLYEQYSDGRPNGLILPGKPYRLDLSTPQNAEVFRHLAAFFGTSRLTVRQSVLRQILPIPEELSIEADEYIFTLAPAIAPAMILNEPLCYYGIHSGNLFQFGAFEPVKARRKMNVLDVLMRELPPRLRKLGATDEIVAAIFRGTRVEAGRIRLSLDGGSPLEAFSLERAAFKASYQQVTWRYRLFRGFVLLQTLLLPPRLFYRMRRWYSEKGLSRFRGWTGEPRPAVQVVERRPG
ncbi:MAG TPA: glycosyltransferase [Candidatus Acidoferrales bacterium]|nr:glycosyltransferase [Candidatus Acidoferrales bacterium]